MDVRNLRGKFDEVKEEFAINPTPIASQLSLNAERLRELKTFLEISLIKVTNRSKVVLQRENTSLFKGKFSPKIVAD